MRDVFISYSTLDRPFVEKLCRALRQANVTFWLDRLEIKPGDYLRQKINAGLNDADYLLAILSPHSLRSEWVVREIDGAMMRELSENKITVIPVLYGNIKASDLPADLRGKLHLDFRNGNIDNTDNFRRLIEFLKPELRRRKELLRELRSGLTASSESEIRLREFALRGTDQLIQQAALTGLAKIRHPSSVAIITERLLNDWGLNTLNHSIRLLGKLGVDGLAGLAAGAFWDDRLAGDILRVLTYGLQSDKRFAKHINENIHDNGISLMSASVALSDHSPEPIASAFRFSSQYWFEGKKKPFFLPKLSRDSRGKKSTAAIFAAVFTLASRMAALQSLLANILPILVAGGTKLRRKRRAQN